MAENEKTAHSHSTDSDAVARVYKIKEGCIRSQEKDIADQLLNVRDENTKSALVIGFIGAMAAVIPEGTAVPDELRWPIMITFAFAVGISLYNIFSKPALSHRKLHPYFVNRTDHYELFLNESHMTLSENYQNISDLLKKKVLLTGLSYLSAAAGAGIVLIGKLF